jgi:hypothetical protein
MFVAMAGAGNASAKVSTTAKPVRNPERDQWLREHREEQRRDVVREQNERKAMQQWDREHNVRPVPVKHQDPAKAPQKLETKSSRKRTANTSKHRKQSSRQRKATARKKNSKVVATR